MRKRIISLLCVMSMISLFSQNIYAEETDTQTNRKVETLRALNLLTDDNKITNDTFVYSVAGFLYENPEAMGSAEEIARRTGMIGVEETYNAEKVITFNDAIRYAVVVLGYESRAELLGGYPNGYLNVASELKITNGMNAVGNGIILLGDAATLLYNMIDVNPMVAYYKNETQKGYAVDETATLLSLNRDIYEISGLMTANEKTSLYGEKGTSDGLAMIDEKQYTVGESCRIDLIGYNVDAYVKNGDSGEQTIIHIAEKEKKNDAFTLDAELVEYVAEDYSVIEYSDGSDKLKKAKLAPVPKIILNGVYYDGYNVNDLAPDVGEITFVDNNLDGKYDVLLITSYQSIVVESLNSIDSVIYNRYKFDGAVKELTLDEEETDFVIFDKEGKEAEFSQIKIGDVLSVAKSKNGAEVKIYISGNEKLAEKVNSVNNEDMEMNVGGQDYKLTEEFISYLNYTEKSTAVGEQYIFFIDFFGNIVYMESYVTMEYNLFYRMYEENDLYYVVYMDINNTWKTAQMAEKVKHNEIKYKASELYGMLKDMDPQVVRLKENANGQITKLDIAALSTSYVEDKFTKTNEATYVYRLNPNSFAMSLYIEDDAKLFVFPGDKYNKDDYYVRSASGFFTADRSYTVTAYDQDEYGFCPVFSITDTASTQAERANKGMFIVTSVFTKEIDGEIVSVIKGNYGQYKNLTLVGNDLDTYSEIAVGDIINVGLNAKGRANYVKKILSLNNFTPSDPLNYYQSSAIVAGTIEKIDLEKGRFKINCGNSVSFRISADSSVQIYTQATKKCVMKNASELHAGDKVVCRITHGIIAEIACVRER